MTRKPLAALTLGLSLAAVTAVFAAPATQPDKPYPLSTCIVSGEALGGDMGEPIIEHYKGQEIKFCCSSCPKKFHKDPDKYIKQMNEEAAKHPTTAPSK